MTAITWVVDAAYAADLAGALRAQGFPVVGIAEPAPATTTRADWARSSKTHPHQQTPIPH